MERSILVPGSRVCISGPSNRYDQDEIVIRAPYENREPIAKMYVGERIYGLLFAVTNTSDLDSRFLEEINEQKRYMINIDDFALTKSFSDNPTVYVIRTVTMQSIDEHTGQAEEIELRVWRGIVLAVVAPRFAKVSLWQ